MVLSLQNILSRWKDDSAVGHVEIQAASRVLQAEIFGWCSQILNGNGEASCSSEVNI